MFGAIIGDVVGSRFEFDNCKSKEFELFTNTCDYTDDTVMTLAVAKALLLYDAITDMDAFKRELVRVMHEVGMPHPHCGYGGRFCTWMMKNYTEPYGSYGNGSAMRVSPVAWFAGSMDECEKLAAATAEVTHNLCLNLQRGVLRPLWHFPALLRFLFETLLPCLFQPPLSAFGICVGLNSVY